MQTAKSFEAIFERLMKAAGVRNDSELARALGITPQSVNGARKRGEVPPAWVQSYAERTGTSSDWLFFGRGPMRVEEQAQAAPAGKSAFGPETVTCADCELVMVPMVEARLSAGNGSFEVGADVERRYAFRTDFLLRKGSPSSMVLMRVDGDSMEPYVLNGDVVLVDQSQRDPRPGKVYAVGVEELVYLKVVNASPGKLVLTSYNASYAPLEIDARGDLADGVRIIGRAVWVGRELG
ncbi:MAG TPA: helix-turn-helix transcriptional regulator [Desulfovibrio sp.]|jgi:phage repressor protein C with HTH and peptisase S24 domain|uniref:Putative phage repressor n=1 Tax=Nitratidesulfovibrio vulgaris (strain DSM 19637 / Miyazaki F) TaxID=883 RepID=B8DLE8_NITV9|nr:S24 family peptidase [Nitratidesulfovibrio termitidis]HCG05539.1 helix-turn-helix transcriptional regulator [Desulfovibrio sp.]